MKVDEKGGYLNHKFRYPIPDIGIHGVRILPYPPDGNMIQSNDLSYHSQFVGL